MSAPLGNNNELQLNVTQICEDTGKCTCKRKPSDLTVSKKDQVPEAKDFISCTHKANKSFLLQQVLGDDSNRLQTNLENVTSVTVYYWKRALTNPLFLKVERSDTEREEYYYKYAEDEEEVKAQDKDPKTWTKSSDSSIQLQERLDDRNCGINGAIVFDLQETYSGSTSVGDTKSTCKREKRKITKSKSQQVTSPENYTVKAYDITGTSTNTRISRVTYGRASTTGIYPPLTATSQIRVYYWKYKGSIPLLIEFKPHGTGQSTWFANTSQASTQWKRVGGNTSKFYDPTGAQPQDALTTKLDEVNCKLNNVAVIDIGKKQGESYCHNPNGEVGDETHEELIKVTDISKNSIYNGNIGKFVVYSHDLSDDAKKKPHLNGKFHISNFLKNGKPITFNVSHPSLPLLNVTKFLVFWCGSGPKAQPLLFYLEYGTQQKDWFKKPNNDGDHWIKLEVGKKPSDENDTKTIWDILNSYDTKCKFKWWHIITGTAGGGATGGVGYWAYKGFEWFFMAPWPRLM